MSIQLARRRARGFTLAEVLVATTLISIIMASVYTLFNSTTRAWRESEGRFDIYQNARTSLAVLKREIDNVVSPAGYFFQGDNQRFEMVVVSEPFNVEDSEGRHMMWVRYRYNRTGRELIRDEALVEMALPKQPPRGQAIDRGRLKMRRREQFVVAANVEDFSVRYVWIPIQPQRDKKQPPPPVTPIYADRHEEGWGLPTGIEVRMTVIDPGDKNQRRTFLVRKTILNPSAGYRETDLQNMLGGLT
jgi:prepilin-type N-terminal cleavage/methylation domain-containing protein